MAKPKLAVCRGSGCSGCDLSVLDLDGLVPELAGTVDLVLGPLALDLRYRGLDTTPDRAIEICLLSGAIRNSEDERTARLARQKSKVLVAYGACAHMGGIPGLANFIPRRDLLRHVYLDTASTVNPEGTVPLEKVRTPVGELELPRFFQQVRPLDRIVPVDFRIPGCPPVPEKVCAAIEAIATGQVTPRDSLIGASEVALCHECPREKSEKHLREFSSIATFAPEGRICLLEQGVLCCGPGTRAGCGARCLLANMPCRGCYGPPPGVIDQGAKLLSAIASIIDSTDPAEVERIVAGLQDPAGTFYRFSLAGSLLPGAHHAENVT